MTVPTDQFGKVDIRRYILQVLQSQEAITNLVGNNIYFTTNEAYKALQGDYQNLIAIGIISDNIETMHKRKILAQFTLYGKSLKNLQMLANAIRFVFDYRLEDGIFSQVNVIRDMDGLSPNDGYRIDVDVRFIFKD